MPDDAASQSVTRGEGAGADEAPAPGAPTEARAGKMPEGHTDAPTDAARLADEFLSSLPAPSGASGAAGVHDTRGAAPLRSDAEAARAPAAPATPPGPPPSPTVPTPSAAPMSESRATRPPPRPQARSIAAAVNAGMLSAGLALLQAPSAASAVLIDTTDWAVETSGRAHADVPLIGQPPRYEREIQLPVAADFQWPEFGFIAFYEHSGEEREDAARRGDVACSVADRRTVIPPSVNCWHVIGTVQQFVAVYPHPIRRQRSHITCAHGNWASHITWPAKIRDGSMRAAAEELLWVVCLGDQAAAEQPSSAHAHTVGPPTCTIKGHQVKAPDKTYDWWLRNWPPVAVRGGLAAEERWNELAVSGSTEVKTIARSYTPRNMCRALGDAHDGFRRRPATWWLRPNSCQVRPHIGFAGWAFWQSYLSTHRGSTDGPFRSCPGRVGGLRSTRRFRQQLTNPVRGAPHRRITT